MIRKRHWLKGDCHLHTTNSDGKLTPEQLYEALYKKGMDFAFITDHNVNTVGDKAFYYKDVAIFPGIEITGTLGHVNIWGENLPFGRIDTPRSRETYLEHLDKARKVGAHISVNHPLDRRFFWQIDRDNFDMQSVEVWNSPQHTDNIHCMKWWVSRIIDGVYYPAVGGSDYHEDFVITDLLGVPTTYVYSESNSMEDVLAAIKRGNVFVTNSPKAPCIYLTCGEAVPGDTVKYSKGMKVKIEVDKLKPGQTIRVFHNEKVVFEKKAILPIKNFSKEIEIEGEGFVRADVQFKYSPIAEKLYCVVATALKTQEKGEEVPDMVYSFTNPIFIK